MLSMIHGHGPHHWHLSEIYLLKKPNLKRGALGIRQIHILDPVRKSWFRVVWERGSPVRLPDFAYGFAKGKRREGAILHMNTFVARLRSSKKSFLVQSYDCSNAFRSLAHGRMTAKVRERFQETEEMKKQFADMYAEFMCGRHLLATFLIKGLNETKVLFWSGSGGMQGDSAMPEQFSTSYNQIVSFWQSLTPEPKLKLIEPITQLEVEVDVAGFVDDLCRILLHEGTWPETLAKKASIDTTLHTTCSMLDLFQNLEKMDLVSKTYGYHGCTANENMKNFMKKTSGFLWKCTSFLALPWCRHQWRGPSWIRN